jgi:hypothetical protein
VAKDDRVALGGWPLAYENIKIFLGCLAISIALGWSVNIVTAHVAVEHFTVYHPPVVDSDSPLMLALVWGVRGAWWLGVICGLALVILNWVLRAPLPASTVLVLAAKAACVIWLTMLGVLLTAWVAIEMNAPSARGDEFNDLRRIFAVRAAHGSQYVIAALALLAVALQMAKVSREQDAGNV